MRTSWVASRWSRRPPGHGVRSPSASARSTADSTAAASLLHGQIRVAASARRTGTSPAGWRRPSPRCPARSRAPARTARGCAGPSPSEALGSIPIEPVSIAASSLRMSPNMFSVRITSKWRGRGDQLHRGVVDEQVLELDVRELRRVDLANDLAPQPARLEHVGLVDARHARARGLECDSRDPLDLLARVDADVGGGVGGARLLAEVDPAGELAHHHEIGAVDHLALQRARVVQRRQRAHRPQVGEQAEPLSQSQQPLLRTRLRRIGRVPLRARRPPRAAPRRQPGRRRVSRRSARCRGRRSTRRRRGAPRTRSSAPTAPSTSTAGAMISGPMPSPGSRITKGAIAAATVPDGAARGSAADEHGLRLHELRGSSGGRVRRPSR